MTGRRPLGRLARIATAVLAALLLVVTAWAWWDSRLPGTYDVHSMGAPERGGGTVPGAHHHGDGAVPVTALTEQSTAPADERFSLTARAAKLQLRDGSTVEGYTLNGSTPGPEVRVTEGDLVEVTLHNEDVQGGATLHWHGLDVPNAMDGVAGVTQDAVRPGASFTYRFTAHQVGTYWYHSHQLSHRQVLGGLFGAVIVEPRSGPLEDAVMVLHTYPASSRTVNGPAAIHSQSEARRGSTVRVRVINTENVPMPVWIAGSDFRVLAIDGTDVHEPTVLRDQKVLVTAGGRADIEVAVPTDGAVRVQAPGVSLSVGPAGVEAPTVDLPGLFFDALPYGTPTELAFDPAAPDRTFRYDIGRRPGFLNGSPGWWWTINGSMGRHVPMFMVAEGDAVRMTVTNGSGEVHPMHLHGHHLLVLSRDGVAATGSPWWVDSLNVGNGESYEVAFVADNPGIWMDHCHNLPHAREGLMTHLTYEGVTTPFLLGHDSGNEPE